MPFSIKQTPLVYKDVNNQVIASPNRSNTLDMDSFLQLMAAQISNQDVMNPSSNEDYVAQMVQMTMIQAITNMMDMSMTSYASSMIGKNVVLAEIDESGKVREIEGVVTGVSIYGNEPIIHVNGKNYNLSQVMTVGKAAEAETKPNPDPDPVPDPDPAPDPDPNPSEGDDQNPPKE